MKLKPMWKKNLYYISNLYNCVFCWQKSIKAAMDAPEILPSDFAKFDRPSQLHVAFKALSDYEAKTGSLPKPRCQVFDD